MTDDKQDKQDEQMPRDTCEKCLRPHAEEVSKTLELTTQDYIRIYQCREASCRHLWQWSPLYQGDSHVQKTQTD